MLRKYILQAPNTAEMKHSIWHNVVETLYNLTVNIEKNCKNGNVYRKQ